MVLKYFKKNSRSGFTLIELLIVIGIVAVLTTIAMPMMKNMIPNYRLRSGALNIVSSLQEMKLRAVNENANVVIVFNLAKNSYISFVDNGTGAARGNRALDAGEAIVRQETLPQGIIYDSIPTAGKFAFKSAGLPETAVGMTVSIKNSNSNNQRIIVSPAGNVRVEKSSDGSNWN